MKRIITSIITAILLVTLACPSAFAVTTAEKELLYNSALDELEAYMENPGDPQHSLVNVISTFEALNNFKFSRKLLYYAQAIQKIEMEEFDVLYDFFLERIVYDESFTQFISESTDYITLGTPLALKAYGDGRKAEMEGNTDAALTYYRNCTGFFDSDVRSQRLYLNNYSQTYANAIELFCDNKLVDAYFEFVQCREYQDSEEYIDFIIKKLGSTPTQPEITSLTKATATPGATTPMPTATTPVPTSTPAPTPVVTPQPEYSDWVTELPAGVQAAEEKTQYRSRTVYTEYRSRDLKTTQSQNSQLSGWTQVKSELVYGPWSEYSETPVTGSSTLEVQQTTQEKKKDVTVWNYSRWEYYHVDHPNTLWHSCVDYSKQCPAEVLKVVGWKYTTSTTRFTNIGIQGGCVNYRDSSGVKWYNEKSSTKTETQKVTVYRSRTISKLYTYQRWGDWSDWTRNTISETASRQVETRKQYTKWSGWQDANIAEHYGNEVQTRTLYKYRIR